MRCLTLLLILLSSVSPFRSMPRGKQVAWLHHPPGATLPIVLVKTIRAQNMTAGRLVTARLFQRVPVSSGTFLPDKVEIVGHIVGSSPFSLSILFTELRWKNQTVPIHVRLVAAASSNNVYQTTIPLGATDRGTSDPADWTTRQVGGDEVYRSAGSGRVYDQYSQPVGHADLYGVYAEPTSVGELPRAMGPFSTTTTGLHGLPNFSIVSPGGVDAPITFGASKPKWQIVSGAALLLEVVR